MADPFLAELAERLKVTTGPMTLILPCSRPDGSATLAFVTAGSPIIREVQIPAERWAQVKDHADLERLAAEVEGNAQDIA